MRSAQGSQETYYEVQSWGNGRAGLDSEWERFHDAWKESFLQGGYFNQGPGSGFGNGFGNGYGNGFSGQFGYGGYGGPGYGYGNTGYGFPGNGFPGIGNGGPVWGQQRPWHGDGGHDHSDGGHDDGHAYGGNFHGDH